jgi:acetate kinase
MPEKIVTCHLGNGSSITAIKDGKSVDTSMGLTPLEGVIMGTRSGSFDPSIVCIAAQNEGLDFSGITNVLNKKSGLIGISGVSSDLRDLHAAADKGNARAQLAIDLLVYDIKKYIGSYAAAMGGLDAVIFTGGIGENDVSVREEICADMEFLGIKIDPEKNRQRKETCISAADSKVRSGSSRRTRNC